MRLIHGVLGLAAGLALSAAPLLAKKIPALQKEGVSSSSSNFTAQGQTEGARPAAGSTPVAPEQGAHMDHKSKHGGTFFMALDNKHHLEGIIVPPGTFRLYLYDDHTKPLKAQETRQASGTVQVGESDDAPKIDLAPGKKKETLEASLGNGVKFPVTLTLLMHLPGMQPDAKPELFNFKFTQFTDERGPGTCHPMASMPNMRC
jgi:hypothetical protein